MNASNQIAKRDQRRKTTDRNKHLDDKSHEASKKAVSNVEAAVSGTMKAVSRLKKIKAKVKSKSRVHPWDRPELAGRLVERRASVFGSILSEGKLVADVSFPTSTRHRRLFNFEHNIAPKQAKSKSKVEFAALVGGGGGLDVGSLSAPSITDSVDGAKSIDSSSAPIQLAKGTVRPAGFPKTAGERRNVLCGVSTVEYHRLPKKSLYSALRDRYDPEHSESPMDPLYCFKALCQREALLFHPEVRATLDEIWVITDSDNSGAISFSEYELMHEAMSIAVYGPTYLSKPTKVRMQLCIQDWDMDRGKSDVLNYAKFTLSWFQLADQFTERIRVKDYVDYLRSMFFKMVEIDAVTGRPRWKAEKVIAGLETSTNESYRIDPQKAVAARRGSISQIFGRDNKPADKEAFRQAAPGLMAAEARAAEKRAAESESKEPAEETAVVTEPPPEGEHQDQDQDQDQDQQEQAKESMMVFDEIMNTWVDRKTFTRHHRTTGKVIKKTKDSMMKGAHLGDEEYEDEDEDDRRASVTQSVEGSEIGRDGAASPLPTPSEPQHERALVGLPGGPPLLPEEEILLKLGLCTLEELRSMSQGDRVKRLTMAFQNTDIVDKYLLQFYSAEEIADMSVEARQLAAIGAAEAGNWLKLALADETGPWSPYATSEWRNAESEFEAQQALKALKKAQLIEAQRAEADIEYQRELERIAAAAEEKRQLAAERKKIQLEAKKRQALQDMLDFQEMELMKFDEKRRRRPMEGFIMVHGQHMDTGPEKHPTIAEDNYANLVSRIRACVEEPNPAWLTREKKKEEIVARRRAKTAQHATKEVTRTPPPRPKPLPPSTWSKGDSHLAWKSSDCSAMPSAPTESRVTQTQSFFWGRARPQVVTSPLERFSRGAVTPVVLHTAKREPPFVLPQPKPERRPSTSGGRTATSTPTSSRPTTALRQTVVPIPFESDAVPMAERLDYRARDKREKELAAPYVRIGNRLPDRPKTPLSSSRQISSISPPSRPQSPPHSPPLSRPPSSGGIGLPPASAPPIIEKREIRLFSAEQLSSDRNNWTDKMKKKMGGIFSPGGDGAIALASSVSKPRPTTSHGRIERSANAPRTDQSSSALGFVERLLSRPASGNSTLSTKRNPTKQHHHPPSTHSLPAVALAGVGAEELAAAASGWQEKEAGFENGDLDDLLLLDGVGKIKLLGLVGEQPSIGDLSFGEEKIDFIEMRLANSIGAVEGTKRHNS